MDMLLAWPHPLEVDYTLSMTPQKYGSQCSTSTWGTSDQPGSSPWPLTYLGYRFYDPQVLEKVLDPRLSHDMTSRLIKSLVLIGFALETNSAEWDFFPLDTHPHNVPGKSSCPFAVVVITWIEFGRSVYSSGFHWWRSPNFYIKQRTHFNQDIQGLVPEVILHGRMLRPGVLKSQKTSVVNLLLGAIE